MLPRILIRISLAVAALSIAASAAAADLYKWVDERGVTNYSNEPPDGAKAARKLAITEGRVSVYTPDKMLLEAVEASRQKAIDDVRTGRYQRQLEAEHLARLRIPPAPPTYPGGYDPCLDAANVDLCNNRILNGPFGYGAGPVFVPMGRHVRPVPQAPVKPGATAGEMVGLMEGVTPGNSAFAPGTLLPAQPAFSRSRPAREGRR